MTAKKTTSVVSGTPRRLRALFCNRLALGWSVAVFTGVDSAQVPQSNLVQPRERPIGQAPAVVQILRELVAGATSEHLRRRTARILERIDSGRSREPGEDDE